MNWINDRTHRAAPSVLPRLKRKALPLSLSLLGMAAGSCFPLGNALAAGPAANALPTGGTVISGVATVSSTANTMTINQTSAQISMNWTSFDIGSASTVMFNQTQGASSVALNRIGIGSSSPVASQIYGVLTAPGQVFLINPAGIVFGNGAQVSVGGLVASTLDVNGTTTSNGHTYYDLLNSGGSASIINQGTINAASGGGVILVGGNVVNTGLIAASAGHIFLDGANRITVDFDGNNLVNVVLTGALTTGPGTGAAVSNSGTLTADGGTIVLQASATPGLFTQMVNNVGVVQANSISGTGGTVQLLGLGGDVDTSGTISATGGNIAVSSDGSIGLNGAVNAGSGQVVLSSQQAITQTANSGSSPASVITAATLSGSSIGSTTLTQANQIQSVSSFSSGNSFSLTNGAGASLQVGGLTVSGGSVALGTAAGSNLALNGNVNAQSLSLSSGGAITQSGGALTVAALSGVSSGSTTLGQVNNITALGNFSTNGFSLNNGNALAINGALNSGAGTATLNVAGTITEGAGGSITAGTLAGSSTSSTTLGQVNNIAALGNFSANGFSLNNGSALAINGALNGGAGTTTLNVAGAITEGASGSITAGTLAGSSTSSTTLGLVNNIAVLSNFSANGFSLKNSSALAINGALNSGTGTTTLNVIGAITEGANGSITASTFTGSSTGSTTLGQVNNIAALGNFSANGFSLNNGNALAINGALNSGAGSTTLNVTGAITENAGGSITAGTLAGSSSGSTTLGQTNNITALGDFSANGFSLNNGNALAINGALNSGTGTTTLNVTGAITEGANGSITAGTLAGSSTGSTTLSQTNNITALGNFSANGFSLNNGNALAINGALNSGTGTTTLNVTGAITEGASGSITAGTFTGSSTGSTTLGQANNITALGNFSANGFNLNNGNALAITGALNSGASTTTLNVTGDITEGANGSITAGSLAGSSTGSTTLSQANNITALGNFSANGFSLNNGNALAINGALNSGTGTTTLNVTGDIAEGANGSITAGTFTGSSTGSTTLGQANSIATLGNFSANGFSLKNGQALMTTGALAGGAGVALTTTSGDLTLNGTVSGSSVALNAADSLTEGSGASISALSFSGSSGGNTVLTQTNNDITTLDTYFSGGDFSLVNAGGIAQTGTGTLTVLGNTTLDAGTNAISLGNSNQLHGTVSLTGGSTQIANDASLILGNSTITGDLTATTLNNAAIGQNGALNVTGMSTFDAGTGSITLGAYNQLQGAVGLTGGNTLINNAGALNLGVSDVSGSLTASTANTNATISQSGALTVTGTSTFKADATSGTGAISLTDPGNAFGSTVNLTGTGIAVVNQGNLSVGTLSDGANGSLSLTSLNGGLSLPSASIDTGTGDLTLIAGSGSLTPSGDLAGHNVSLKSYGALTLPYNVTAANTLSLTSSNGGITQSGGALTAAVLSGSSQGVTSLGQLNLIGQLGNFAADGFSLLNAQTLTATGALSGGSSVALTTTAGDLAINGAVSGTNVTLTSAGAITEGIGGSITTGASGSLSGSSVGSTALNQVNDITTLGGFSANNFSLTNAQTLITTSTLNGGAGIALTSTNGDLVLNGTMIGNTVSLSALGGISEGAGASIATATLSGSSGGNTTLNQANNSITTLGTYASGGNFSLTNNAAITQSGALTVLGDTTLSAGANAIMLGGSNQLHGVVSLVGGNTLVNNVGALNLGASNISGDLTATTASAGATISQSGALTVAGTSTFMAGGAAGAGAIALADANNAFGSTVSATGTGIAIRSGGDLRVAALHDGANGAVNLIAGGALYLPSNAIDTGSADLTLSALGGSLVNAGSLTGANVSLSGSQGITLANNVFATHALNLTSSGGAITQTGGVLSAPLLTGSSQGVTTLTQGNQISQLGGFAANGFSLTNAGGLTVSGPLNSASSTTLTTTSGDLTLQGAVSGTDVTLTASHGAVIQSGGALVANTFSGSSAGTTSLTQGNNAIGSLGSYSSGGDFSLTDANALMVSGALSSAGNIALTSGGNITLANAVNGNTIALNANAGTISQTGGTLTTGTLMGQSSGTTLLTQANQIGSLGNYNSGGDFILTNGTAIAQSGSLQVQGATTLNAGTNAITLTNSANNLHGTVSLTGGNTQIVNSGPLVFGASQINGNLSATSNDPTVSQVGALNVTGSSYFNAGNDSIQLTNPNNHLAGPVTAIGTGIAITNAGDLHVASLTNGTNGAVSLISLGGTLFLPSTAIATGSSDLLLTSGGGSLSTVADLSGSNVALSGSGGISLGNVITATNNLSLVSGGAINQSAGTLNARTLTGSSSGATTLMQANNVGSVGGFNANGFSLTNANNLTIAGPLLSTGGVTLITQSGDLDVTGTLSGSRVVLNAAGAINESPTGNIVATTLSGRAGGATSLGTQSQPIANHIGTLGGFDSPAGFSLTNGQTLTLASVDGSSYTVNAGTSALYLAAFNGSLLQTGTTPLYSGQGTYAASDHIGLVTAPIYAFGTLPYVVQFIGLPPAYFHALDRRGNLLPEAGSMSINLLAIRSINHALGGNNNLDSYIDAGTITASYRGYGIVPTGIRLPPDQDTCDPQKVDCRSE
ncbi:beta strand repeat-containing protein [Dyella sp. 20L07]|uniref:beta strand repeat-containing protein n=1 Tax=Dyella sp. 20L07 TaxID=3384240 RepID=UPI003D2B7517